MTAIRDPQTALYEKLSAEQGQYTKWLLGQPPNEILNHAYEYTIREDILLEMSELELTDAQATALWRSASPMADIYKAWQKLETHHMENIEDVIKSRADDVIQMEQKYRKAEKER